ncbi:PTS transporter subunit EIIC [uncultured Mobiluncus sp.]|uniref:PTS transporter subunit EIIC n=1 Tax=uncultured Mobiluncus sp. TaxID=293425 RepID=UPI002889439C|nr:PTS transporter subunit EIIC [uncultured Mobiluncus sp.]
MLRKGSAGVAGKGKTAKAVDNPESGRVSAAESRAGKAKKKAEKPPAAKKPAKRTKGAKVPRAAVKQQRFARFLAPGWYERFLQYLFVAILILCAAELSLRLGQGHILGDQGFGKVFPGILPIADILYYVGTTVESYFPLIVAFMLAFAAAKRPNAAIGLAALAGWVGYLGATMALSRYSTASSQGEVSGVDLGLMGGILVGFLVAGCWSEFRFRKVAPWARMVSGIPLVVMICATGGVVLGIVVGVFYQLLYLIITVAAGTAMMVAPGPLGAALYGFLHPIAEVTGFSALLNIAPYNLYGSCQTTQGDTLNGSYRCFVYGGTQMEGQQALFLAGGYPVVAFGLAALFLVLLLQLKGGNRQYWRIMYWFLIAGTFLVGAEKPALYLLFFAAPALLMVHAVASAFSYAITAALGVTIGWAGGPGLVDLMRWMGTGEGILVLLILGVLFAAIYVMVAIFTIKVKGQRLNLGGFGVPYITKPFMGIPNSSGETKPAPAVTIPKPAAVKDASETGVSASVREETPVTSPAPTRPRPSEPVVETTVAVPPTPAQPVATQPAMEPPVIAEPVALEPESSPEVPLGEIEPVEPVEQPLPAEAYPEAYTETSAAVNPAYPQQGYVQNPYGYQAPGYPETYPAYPAEYGGGYNSQLYGYQGTPYGYPAAYNPAAMPQATSPAQNFSAPQTQPQAPAAPPENPSKPDYRPRPQ